MERIVGSTTRGWRRWLAAVLIATICVAALSACGDDDATVPTSTTTTQAGAPTATRVPLTGDITVFAAASLTDSFKEAGKAFEAAHPGVHVTFNFAGSSALATQINQGAPAVVFASADAAQMKVVTEGAGSSAPQNFVTNVPVVVVPASGSPVAAFADLAKPGVKLVLASPAVPIGNYARQIFTKASTASGAGADFSDKVLANLKSNEADVKSVLAKIQVGEGDAGVVYKTDATVAGNQVKTIEIPTQYNVIASYPIATVNEAKNATVAAAFVAFIRSDAGQQIMAKYGFGKPAQ
jgi:molybdate transport system substrate-binding protein